MAGYRKPPFVAIRLSASCSGLCVPEYTDRSSGRSNRPYMRLVVEAGYPNGPTRTQSLITRPVLCIEYMPTQKSIPPGNNDQRRSSLSGWSYAGPHNAGTFPDPARTGRSMMQVMPTYHRVRSIKGALDG